MKVIVNIVLIASLGTVSANAFDFGKAITQGAAILEGAKNGKENGTSAVSALSTQEVSRGLKEALSNGIEASIRQLSTTDGFYTDHLVKILLPERMQSSAALIKKAGGEQYINDFVLAMNRAAEQSVTQVAPIFTDALSDMNINDAQRILQGGDYAATAYFEKKTSNEIIKTVAPILQGHMQENSVYTYYNIVKNYYDKLDSSALIESVGGSASAASLLSSVSKVTIGDGALLSKEELDHYMSTKTAEGIFTVIRNQEKKIRSTLGARSTPLLKKVFGAK